MHPGLTEQLAPAWTFLRGAQRGFDAHVPPPVPQPCPDDHALVLPLRLLAAPERQAAVGVLIDRDEARAVARHLFERLDDEISADELNDACREACNILAGSVVAAYTRQEAVEMGLPREISADEYRRLLHSGQVRGIFLSDASARRIAVTLIDEPAQLATPGSLS